MINIIDQIKVLTYIRRKHLSSEIMTPHSHNLWEIIYCSKGTIEIESIKNDITSSKLLHTYQYALIEPNIKHCLHFKEDSHLMVLELQEKEINNVYKTLANHHIRKQFPSLFKAYSKIKNVIVLNDTSNLGQYIDEFISLFVNITNHTNSNSALTKAEYSITLEKILLTICRDLNKMVDKKSNIYINKCINYINTHYTEDIKIDDIAKTINLSPSYLERIFKKEYNQSIIEYIIHQRLNHAISLLKTTSLSYKNIAIRSGFKNYIQLYKTFKTKLNCTIDEFKQNRDSVNFFHEDFHNA